MVDRAFHLNSISVPVGNYFLFPLIETGQGKPNITRYILASREGVKLEEIDQKSGRTSDGAVAVVITVNGVATLKDSFSSTRARFASSDQIATIWFGLKGDNREWSSQPLELPKAASAPHPVKR